MMHIAYKLIFTIFVANHYIVHAADASLAQEQHVMEMLIKETQLDVQILKTHSDNIIEQATFMPNDNQQYSIERLLFSNEHTKIYGAYNVEFFGDKSLAACRSYTELLVKSGENVRIIKLKKGINFNEILLSENGLYALVKYADYKQNSNYVPRLEIIDLKDGKIIYTLEGPEEKCCVIHRIFLLFDRSYYLGNNHLYFVEGYNGQEILVKSVKLSDSQEIKTIATLENNDKEKVIGIVSDKNEKHIIIATQKTIYIINIDDGKVIKTIKPPECFASNKNGIRRVFASHKGEQIAIVSGKHEDSDKSRTHVYLLDLINPELWVEISDQLKGNLYKDGWLQDIRKFYLDDVKNIQWTPNDSLLLLDCVYYYELYNGAGRLEKSAELGSQYAFVCAKSYNAWSESNIRPPKSSRINPANTQEIITTTDSWVGPSTNISQWYDANMTEALDYFAEDFSLSQNVLGIALLLKIMMQKDADINLDENQTKKYDQHIPGSVKNILKLTKAPPNSYKNEFYLGLGVTGVAAIVALNLWSK